MKQRDPWQQVDLEKLREQSGEEMLQTLEDLLSRTDKDGLRTMLSDTIKEIVERFRGDWEDAVLVFKYGILMEEAGSRNMKKITRNSELDQFIRTHVGGRPPKDKPTTEELKRRIDQLHKKTGYSMEKTMQILGKEYKLSSATLYKIRNGEV